MTVIKYYKMLLSIDYPQKRDTFNMETKIHPEIHMILAFTLVCKQHEFVILSGVSLIRSHIIYKFNATRGKLKRQSH